MSTWCAQQSELAHQQQPAQYLNGLRTLMTSCTRKNKKESENNHEGAPQR